jgi:hypothetical protein
VSVNRFVNQMKMSVLTGAPEIAIWCYPEICHPDRAGHIDALAEVLPELRSLSPLSHGFNGVPTIEQLGMCKASSPESSIFDHLGTIGVTVAQRNSISESDRGCLITEHSDLSGLRQWVHDGGKAIVTSGGVRRMVEAGLADLTGLDTDKPFVEDLAFVTVIEMEDGQQHRNYRGHESLSLPFGPVVNPLDAVVTVWGLHKDRRIPLVMRRSYGKGEVVTLCITDVPHCMTRVMSESLRKLLRDLVGEITGVVLAPAKEYVLPRVALFPFEGTIAMLNLEDCPISLALRVNPEIAGASLDGIEMDTDGWQEKPVSMGPGEIVSVPLKQKKRAPQEGKYVSQPKDLVAVEGAV